MSTTQIFVELLIIGLGGIIWLSIFISGIFKGPVENFVHFPDAVYALLIVCVAYVMGIIIDRIAYGIFNSLEKRNGKRILKDYSDLTVEKMLYYISTNSEELKNKIFYNRSRLRICRSWIINFCLIAISITFLNVRKHALSFIHFILLLTILVILIFLTFYVWNELSKDHLKSVKQSYEFLKAEKGDGV